MLSVPEGSRPVLKQFLEMYLQAEGVTKFSKNRFQWSRLQAHRQYLVVEWKKDQVYLLILYGNMAHGSALPLKLG